MAAIVAAGTVGSKTLKSSVTSGYRTGKTTVSWRSRAAPVYSFSLMFLMYFGVTVVASDQTTIAQPDLQVGGFSVFGTNVTGATSVTSGWGSVYMDGNLQVNSNVVVNGQIVSTNLVQVRRIAISKNDQLLTAGSAIQPVSSYVRVRGDTEPVSLGSPQIAAGQPGQLLTLQGVASGLKVNLVNGNGLRTNLEQPFSLGEYDTIQFIFDDSSGNWVEINRSNNRWSN